MEKPDEEDLNDVISAIRDMVMDETRAKFSESTVVKEATDIRDEVGDTKSSDEPFLPSKILVLHPHMRVKTPEPEVYILGESARVTDEIPPSVDESFAVANTAIDEGMLRDMVREVVQEQLRGEIGQELVGAIKRDMAQLLEKSR